MRTPSRQAGVLPPPFRNSQRIAYMGGAIFFILAQGNRHLVVDLPFTVAVTLSLSRLAITVRPRIVFSERTPLPIIDDLPLSFMLPTHKGTPCFGLKLSLQLGYEPSSCPQPFQVHKTKGPLRESAFPV